MNNQSLQWLFYNQAAPCPCFVIDEGILQNNADILKKIQEETGAKILLALKAFSCWPVFSILSSAKNGPLCGICASSVDEARLGREEFGGEVHVFSAAYSNSEFNELLKIADCIVFNSLAQWQKFKPLALKANAEERKNSPIKFGLRINPEHSENAPAIYNPCSPGSRLGIRQKELEKASSENLTGISGLHFHTLCEQDSPSLARTLEVFNSKFKKWINSANWLNFGGGHHLTKKGYNLELLYNLLHRWANKAQIYLEPGEAVALNAGWLIASVLDIVEADMPVAILNVSAACHMPDVLEMPYLPPVWYLDAAGSAKKAELPNNGKWNCRLAGNSCLAGDIIGEYSFDLPLKAGSRLVFGDMAIYSMVKTTTFNGLRLPSIGMLEKKQSFRLLRQFGYEDFKTRLG